MNFIASLVKLMPGTGACAAAIPTRTRFRYWFTNEAIGSYMKQYNVVECVDKQP
jgi:hypothetical protein